MPIKKTLGKNETFVHNLVIYWLNNFMDYKTKLSLPHQSDILRNNFSNKMTKRAVYF